MTTFSEKEKTPKEQVKVENYHATYEDVAKVFSEIKNKGILKEAIIMNGQANYKMNKTVVQKENKRTKTKSKKHIKSKEEFEL